MSDDSDDLDYGHGWAFRKIGGAQGGGTLPVPGADLRQWTMGYAAALAEYPDGSASIEAALRADGLTGELLEQVLREAEAIERGEVVGEEWFRWPSIPARDQALEELAEAFAGVIDEEDEPPRERRPAGGDDAPDPRTLIV